jgi:hypothetical protein
VRIFFGSDFEFFTIFAFNILFIETLHIYSSKTVRLHGIISLHELRTVGKKKLVSCIELANNYRLGGDYVFPKGAYVQLDPNDRKDTFSKLVRLLLYRVGEMRRGEGGHKGFERKDT